MPSNVKQLFLLWVLNSNHNNDNGTDDEKGYHLFKTNSLLYTIFRILHTLVHLILIITLWGIGTDINLHITEEETESHKPCQSQLDNDFWFEPRYLESKNLFYMINWLTCVGFIRSIPGVESTKHQTLALQKALSTQEDCR